VRVEKEHRGACKDPGAHKDCEYDRTLWEHRYYALHPVANRPPGGMYLREKNINTDREKPGVEIIPGTGLERRTVETTNRAEYLSYLNAAPGEAFTVVTGGKFVFPFTTKEMAKQAGHAKDKEGRTIHGDFKTFPGEANSDHLVDLDSVGELTMYFVSETLPLRPLRAYRINTHDERKDDWQVSVQGGPTGNSRFRTFSWRWLDLEPGEIVGIAYSWE